MMSCSRHAAGEKDIISISEDLGESVKTFDSHRGRIDTIADCLFAAAAEECLDQTLDELWPVGCQKVQKVALYQ